MSAEETLNKLISTITKEQNYNDCEVIIKEISSGGANYSSRLFTVTVRENGKENLNLFAKVANTSDALRQTTNFGKFYIVEQLMYTDIAKMFTTFEDECSVKGEDRLVFPKYYGSDTTKYNETIVLEDLTATGWESFDRFKSIDWPYASSAFTELAKLHALYFALNQNNPDKYSIVANDFNFSAVGSLCDLIAPNSLVMTLKYAPIEYHENLRNHFKQYSVGSKEFLGATNSQAIIHGDFRPSNLMHRVKQDGTVDIKILDLQTMQICNSPVVDLFYFIFTNSDGEFREKYFKKLLDHYYTQLEASMKRLNLEPEKIYSRTQYEQEWKERLPYGLTIALIALPVITVAPENAPTLDEMLGDVINNTSQLYQDRLNEIINDFVKWGYL